MAAPSLQDGIDKAGSPVNLLWRVNPEPWNPENIEPEYAGWREEQAAWHSGVSISDLSRTCSTRSSPGLTRRRCSRR
jgi:vanillate/3-O-methylgallate O-demethylase